MMNITSEFFSFYVWEWFLHSSVLERTEFDLSKINWLGGVILLIPIMLVPWGRFPLCHTPIRPISAFRDQISILIVGCITTWSRGSYLSVLNYFVGWGYDLLSDISTDKTTWSNSSLCVLGLFFIAHQT